MSIIYKKDNNWYDSIENFPVKVFLKNRGFEILTQIVTVKITICTIDYYLSLKGNEIVQLYINTEDMDIKYIDKLEIPFGHPFHQFFKKLTTDGDYIGLDHDINWQRY